MKRIGCAFALLALSGCATMQEHPRAWIIAGSAIAAGLVATHDGSSDPAPNRQWHLPPTPPRDQSL